MASNDTAAEQKQCGDESPAKDTSGTTPVFPLFDLKKRKNPCVTHYLQNLRSSWLLPCLADNQLFRQRNYYAAKASLLQA